MAVAAASFIYLGFLAAGEEIEQPFGASLCRLMHKFLFFSQLFTIVGYDDVRFLFLVTCH